MKAVERGRSCQLFKLSPRRSGRMFARGTQGPKTSQSRSGVKKLPWTEDETAERAVKIVSTGATATHHYAKDHEASFVGFSPQTSGSPGATTVTEEQVEQANLEMMLQTLSSYPGDMYPEDIGETKSRKLDRHYKAIKEEFHSKSGPWTVTPGNYHQWKRTSRSKRPAQLWEIFSGSGRLSYFALVAGLVTAFPIDYRYGCKP